VEYRTCDVFGFDVPVAVDGIDSALLTPRTTWDDAAAYDAQAQRLRDMFAKNFERFAPHVDSSVLNAGPQMLMAAE
ncbi:MAG: phosphoenolpyruvate carboxykinase (ATP), partial [Pseudomonadota bacterium]